MRCLDKESFLAEFGAVYERSPWVAEAVFEQAMEDCLDMTTLDADTLVSTLTQADFLDYRKTVWAKMRKFSDWAAKQTRKLNTRDKFAGPGWSASYSRYC